MKQVLQSTKSGQVRVEQVPPPLLRPEGLLVRTHVSLISAGTERAALQLAQKSLLGMARQRPDLVQRVRQKLRRDGFLATFQAVRDQLDRLAPLGYSLAGIIDQAGANVSRLHPGQHVACAGAGHASHAELNYVPDLLAAPIPPGVSLEAAAYATIGAIALHGVRNADAHVGETVSVIGLGLIGQLAVQILAASGCRVVALDVSPQRVELAKAHGAQAAFLSRGPDFESALLDFTRGRGADAVLITAATKSNAPVELAARIARDRARVVMVGVTGMNIPRNDYYHKELNLVVSRSYGPGRYDSDYEQRGRDYPVGYVRWTENRNMEAFLDLVASGRVRPEVCTTQRFNIDDAVQAYDLILSNREPHLGVLLTYPQPQAPAPEASRVVLQPRPVPPVSGSIGVSFIGAGGFVRSVLLPAVRRLPAITLRGVVTASGVTARSAGQKFGFNFCATSPDDVLADPATHVVFIATPHSTHADLVCCSLAAGKSVFVEKPLVIDLEQLHRVRQAVHSSSARLMVGFNRRFSPLARDLKAHLAGRGPMLIQYRCNAGPLPADHWLAQPAEGGRIVGEACHFIDLCGFLTDSFPVRVSAFGLDGPHGDDAQVSLCYADGSVCQLLYTSQATSTLGKERLEVFAAGRAGILDDFKRLELHAPGRRVKRRRRLRPDKGHAAAVQQFLAAVRSGEAMPIPFDSLEATTLATFAAVASLRTRAPVLLSEMTLVDRDLSHPEGPRTHTD